MHIDDSACNLASLNLMKFVKGPDFPTGAIIMGRDGIRDAYETGRGSIKIRAVSSVEEGSGGRAGEGGGHVVRGVGGGAAVVRARKKTTIAANPASFAIKKENGVQVPA